MFQTAPFYKGEQSHCPLSAHLESQRLLLGCRGVIAQHIQRDVLLRYGSDSFLIPAKIHLL